MKKYATILLVLILCLSLSACGWNDEIPAVAEISTSNGQAMIVQSVNGSGATVSGIELAISQCALVKMDDGETATVHFFCHTCGHDETIEVTAPDARLLSCDCPETKTDGDTCVREYIALIFGSEQTQELATEESPQP